jgi:hypothetical protein
LVKTVHVRTVLLILSLGLAGCQQKGAPLPPKADTANTHAVKKEAAIVVPDSVKGRWRAVRIAVLDKSDAKVSIYTIPIGGKATLSHSTMTITVQSFLPAFVIEGSTMTSAGNELKNPGAKVRIAENGTSIFSGWMFSRYPTTHAFRHPRFGFTLMDGVPTTP